MELLRNADLYDPAPRGHAHLLIAGETIVWIGRDDPLLSPGLAVTDHDLEGRRVIPGLIDGHKGSLGVGADADLVVLDGEGGVEDVMARGRWLVRSGDPVVRGTFETRE
jgi:cytosine/adenosine deaminase-related metal-dependent hydrolase